STGCAVTAAAPTCATRCRSSTTRTRSHWRPRPSWRRRTTTASTRRWTPRRPRPASSSTPSPSPTSPAPRSAGTSRTTASEPVVVADEHAPDERPVPLPEDGAPSSGVPGGDPDGDPAALSMTEFEEAVGDALDLVPVELMDQLDNVVFLVEEEP